MTDVAVRPRRRAAQVMRPAVNALFVDRYRSGRLRLDAASPVGRWLVRLGIVFLVGLDVSLLYASRGGWRREALVNVFQSDHPLFAPRSLVPFTLVALMVGWMLVLWGAALSSLVVRLTVAVLFVIVNTDLGAVLLLPRSRAAGIRFGPSTVRTGYFAVPALLVVAAAVGAFPRWWRWLRPVVLGGLAIAAVAMFGGLQWINYAAQRNGGVNVVPTGLESSISTTRSLVVPVLFASAVEVLELGYVAVAAAAIPVRELRATMVKIILATLIAVKLTIELISHASEWLAFVQHRAFTAVCSVLAVVFLALAGWGLRSPLRGRTADADESENDEGLIYAGATAVALPLVTVVLLLSLGAFIFEQFHSVVKFLTLDFPSDVFRRAGDIVTAGALVLAGFYLLRRGRRPAVAAAVVMLGGWLLIFAIPGWWSVTVSVNPVLIDIVVTVAVALIIVLWWRRLDGSSAAGLAGLVAFSWIVGTRGAYLGKLLGSFLPAAAIVTIVTGTLWALLTDSSFTAGSSRLFPGMGRPLLWIGLLVTAAAMTNWVQVVHDFDLTGPVATGGAARLGLPLAGWWVLHRRFRPESGNPRNVPIVDSGTTIQGTSEE